MALSPLCGASSCTPAPKPMQQGWHWTLILHKQPQTGLVLHGRFALCPASTPVTSSPSGWLGPLWSGQEKIAEKQRNRVTSWDVFAARYLYPLPLAGLVLFQILDYLVFLPSFLLPLLEDGVEICSLGAPPNCAQCWDTLCRLGTKPWGSQQGDSRVLYNPATSAPAAPPISYGCCGLILPLCWSPMERQAAISICSSRTQSSEGTQCLSHLGS